MTNEETENFVVYLRNTFQRVYQVRMPTIACIDGYALGGGLELGISCDLRIATTKSVLGLPETSLAIIPGAGGTQKLSRIVGIAKAKELIFTGKRLTAQESLNLGLVNYVEEDYEKCYQRALTIAKDIINKGPIAIEMAKASLNYSIEVDLNDGLQFEKMAYARIIRTEDRIEGLKAFNEKRSPQYKGK
eukprot:TRINITY_DN1418_c0_g3_i2.p1 TRINITY_DN1418_c0_g3~~TRINITY_DN1418_c0_g3_i2.p1  ORF type:complete len:189 (+),score=50.67 TRINITY_DN1418_c0_g3_i2:355-921(+)